jgi:RimJ/RimL family protein N-acetyltransferase
VGETVIPLPLETERLLVRPLRLEDAGDLGQAAAWIQEKIDRFERDGGMSLWAVVERASGRAAGLAGLQWEQIDGRRELDLGCVVAKDRRRLGYATEASQAVLQAASAAGYTRVTAMTEPTNTGALAVLERLGIPYLRETTWEGKVYALHALEEIPAPS